MYTYIYLDGTVNDEREYAIRDLRAIFRHAEQVPYVRDLLTLILPLVWEVASE